MCTFKTSPCVPVPRAHVFHTSAGRRQPLEGEGSGAGGKQESRFFQLGVNAVNSLQTLHLARLTRFQEKQKARSADEAAEGRTNVDVGGVQASKLHVRRHRATIIEGPWPTGCRNEGGRRPSRKRPMATSRARDLTTRPSQKRFTPFDLADCSHPGV